MWTKAFWKAAAERALRAGSAAAVSVFLVGDKAMNIGNVNLADAGGIFLGAAAVSVLLGLAGNVVTGTGPSFTKAESVDPVA